MWDVRKLKRAAIVVLLASMAGCSTRPFLDFLDWVKPGRVNLAPDTKPYGGVCIPQGQLPSGGVSPVPGLAPGAVPPPEPLPPSAPNAPVPPPSPDLPPPPAFPN